MRMMRLCLVGILALVLASCSSDKPKDLIIGKWKGKDKMPPPIDKEIEATFEFDKDGNMKMTVEGVPTIEGKYKVIDDETLEIEMGGDKKKGKFSVTKDKLTLKDDKKGNTELTRVK